MALEGIGGVVIYTSCMERIYEKDFGPVIHPVLESRGGSGGGTLAGRPCIAGKESL